MKKVLSILLLIGLFSIEITNSARYAMGTNDSANLRPKNSCCGGEKTACCTKKTRKTNTEKKSSRRMNSKSCCKTGSCSTGCCNRKSTN